RSRWPVPAFALPCSARPGARTARSRSPTTDTRSTTGSATTSPARRPARASTSSAAPGGSSPQPARRSTVASGSQHAASAPRLTNRMARRTPTLPPTPAPLAAEIARYLGAVSILIVGAIHAQQYYDAYFSYVPTIGTLFLLSFIGAGIVGAVLLAPVRRLARLGELILALAPLGAIRIPLPPLLSL